MVLTLRRESPRPSSPQHGQDRGALRSQWTLKVDLCPPRTPKNTRYVASFTCDLPVCQSAHILPSVLQASPGARGGSDEYTPPAAPDPPAEPENFQLSIDFSLTISARGKHCPTAWYQSLKLWMAAATVLGGCALERGGKRGHLHIQAFFRKIVPNVEKNTINRLKADIKTSLSILRGDPNKPAVDLKPFGPGQTVPKMTGYIHKDVGAPHFNVFMHNISQQEVQLGIDEWKSMRISYEDDKILITGVNFFQKLHAYFLTELAALPSAAEMDWLEILTRMLNTGRYMLSSRMLMNSYGQMHYDAACGYWKLIMSAPLTEEEVRAIVCVHVWKPAARGPDTRPRYFESTGSPAPEPAREVNRDRSSNFTTDFIHLSRSNSPEVTSAPATREAAVARSRPRRVVLSDETDADDSDAGVQTRLRAVRRRLDIDVESDGEAGRQRYGQRLFSEPTPRTRGSRFVREEVSASDASNNLEEESDSGDDGFINDGAISVHGSYSDTE